MRDMIEITYYGSIQFINAYIGYANMTIKTMFSIGQISLLLVATGILVNSLRPSDAYMRQQDKPTLVQIMACRLFGAKPLSEPMLE